jgi:hypothetical protein
MAQELNPNHPDGSGGEAAHDPLVGHAVKPHLEDPRVVLSLLEADQVVAAKQRMHFGPRKFSRGVRLMLWGLRVYVVVMMVLVLISVLRAVHVMH